MHTFIVIFAVFAFHFKGDGTIDAFPSLVATAAPTAVRRRFALAVFAAVFRTTFERAVLAIPASHAQARAVLALAVFGTAGVAQPLGAQLACPARIADTGTGLAASMPAAVDPARRPRTVVASPAGVAHAPVQLQAEDTLFRTVGQALHRVAVHL